MFLLSILFAILALNFGTHAAIVDFFHDRNCTDPAGSRNIWDNTCAYTGAWESVRITTKGGSDQWLTAWSQNACAGIETRSFSAQLVGKCFWAYDQDGASNAISSYSCAASCKGEPWPRDPPGGKKEEKGDKGDKMAREFQA
ncbi:hypothetical protein QBC34DRAFT_412116 [Podospora aff. communis PSN243]|uniref:WSC domain-containing protein n=1 Tax=Podospora aff. communis PSN243 TaxID=3040156 RepID=A0AAV9GCJ3_9PEZI|nr:hypothetical protein QBC34DRAFT_412116 [Podospora aff. communis PSN243]